MKKLRLVVVLVSVLLVGVAMLLPEKSQVNVLGARTMNVGWVERLKRMVTWKNHKNKEYGYAIRFPRDWEIEERNTESSRSFKVKQMSDEAYVVVGAFKNESLKEDGGLAKATTAKEAELKNDPDYEVGDFVSGVEGNTAGYMATGRTRMGGKEMVFMEKGLFDSYGKTLLMHGAALPEKTGEYESVLVGIMDSFKVW